MSGWTPAQRDEFRRALEDQALTLARVRSAPSHWRYEPPAKAYDQAAGLLAAVADALNACEAAGLVVALEGGAVATHAGFILVVGEPQICGERFVTRTPMLTEFPADDDPAPVGHQPPAPADATGPPCASCGQWMTEAQFMEAVNVAPLRYVCPRCAEALRAGGGRDGQPA